MTAARLADSWKAPMFDAPSPKNGTATESWPLYEDASAAPTACGMPPPTMPLAPSMPMLRSLMCMLPPRPLQ